MKKIFFTFNDFSKDDGSTVRMYGILNALAISPICKDEIILISNVKDSGMFNKNIKHVYLGVDFTTKDKRVFQALLSILPTSLVYNLFSNKLAQVYNKIRFFKDIELSNLIFFTHLDNSIAYLFYKEKKIPFYVNDLHGLAPMEFKYKKSHSISSMLMNKIKYYTSEILDRKVFKDAQGIICVNQTLKKYLEKKYNFLKNKDIYIVHDAVPKSRCNEIVEKDLLYKIKNNYKISDQDRIIFFAGTFKELGGVLDLIEAFKIVTNKYDDIQLFLIGDGEDYEEAIKRVSLFELQDKVIFTGVIPYKFLRTYQELATIIVCPDKDHPYSQLVPHIKYFDALISSKPVINGKFDSIQEINQNESLSIDFKPSDKNNLADKIIYCLENLPVLLKRYKNNKNIVCKKFNYENSVKELI